MEKNRQPTLKRICLLIFFAISGIIGIFIVYLLDNPHAQFRLQNIVNPVSGEFVFHSNRNGTFQIYHAEFNTAFDQVNITQLTHNEIDSEYARYSPDGQQIAYVLGGWIMVMDADGQNSQPIAEGFRVTWLSQDKLLILQQIGYQHTETTTSCPYYGPFEFNLKTGGKIALFSVPTYVEIDKQGMYHFPSYAKLMKCGLYILRIDEQFVAQDNAYRYALPSHSAWSHDRHTLAEVLVNRPYNKISGIYLVHDEQERKLLIQVHAYHVAWSSDDHYLIYDARHPNGTSVIAITAADGDYTYPLLGNDGSFYYAPDWRPG